MLQTAGSSPSESSRLTTPEPRQFRIPRPRVGRMFVSCTLVLAIVIVQAAAARSQESGTAPDRSVEGISVDIREVRVQSAQSSLQTLTGQVELRVTVRNRSDEAIRLDRSDVRFLVDSRPTSMNLAVLDPLFSQTKSLAPKEETSGWMAFVVKYEAADEPTMQLHWQLGDESIVVDVNRELRKTSPHTIKHAGPDDCLALVEFPRHIDRVAVWLLTEVLRDLEQSGIQRVVLDLQPTQKPRTTSYSQRRSLEAWLRSVQRGAVATGFPFGGRVQASTRFETFHVAGYPYPPSRSYGDQSRVFFEDREHAIAAALNAAYQQQPATDVIAELTHSERGVQRAVLETSIDRLNPTQLQDLYESARLRSPEFRALVAENLYRVALPEAMQMLAAFVRSNEREVSEAAARSLVRSVNSAAARELRLVWSAAQDDLERRQQLAELILEARDYRHLDLLQEFAEDFLRRSGNQVTSSDDSNPEERSAATTRRRPLSRAADVKGRTLLKHIFSFLTEQGVSDFADVARRHVLQIDNSMVQDTTMDFILRHASSGDDRIVEQYIASRLPTATENGSTERAPSTTVLEAIRRYPASRYTPALLNIASSARVSGSARGRTFQVAVRCAGDSQLLSIIDEFSSLGTSESRYLLNQLAAIQHPKWLELARTALLKNDSMQSTALSVLRANGSPEAMQVIADAVDHLRNECENQNAVFERHNAERALTKLSSQVADSTYPPLRQAFNRCNRSTVLTVAQLGYAAIMTFHQRHPGRGDAIQAYDLRKQKKYAEALQVYSQMIDQDPFYSTAYVSRASLLLRDNRPAEAMTDLKYAITLDPENVLIESLIALADIRLGRIAEGLEASEQILKSIPDLKTIVRRDTIYNTACSYGRAAELTDDPDRKTLYLSRGIKLLYDSANAGRPFDDVQHMLDDPDLNAFHDHPEWTTILAQVEANEKRTRGNNE